MKKKITRKKKEELTRKGICWKCGGKLLKTNKIIKCQDCNFERINV